MVCFYLFFQSKFSWFFGFFHLLVAFEVLSALRLDALRLLYTFSPVLICSVLLILGWVFPLLGTFGKVVWVLFLSFLCLFLKNSPFLSPNGSSVITSLEWLLNIFSEIFLSVGSNWVFTFWFFGIAHSVGFWETAKSIPIIHLSLNSNLSFEVYISDLLLG